MRIVTVLILAAAATANGATLYDNGGFNNVNGWSGTLNNDFLLGSNSVVTHATLQILSNCFDNNTPAGSVNWNIYADGGGSPGTFEAGGSATIVNATFVQADAFGCYDIWDVELSNFGNLPLNAGYHFLEVSTNGGANFAFWGTANGGGYGNSPSEFAFTIQGAVPAPGAAALLGIGGLAAARRRRH